MHVDADGREERILPRAVIDASGTWTPPEPARWRTACPRSASRPPPTASPTGVPDLDDPAVRARYAGKRIAVVGSGASALTALVALADLAERRAGHAGVVGAAPGHRRQHLRRRRRRPAARPRRSRPARRGRRGGGHADAVTGFRTDAVAPRAGRPPRPGRRRRAPAGRGRRGHRRSPASARTCPSCPSCASTWTRCSRRPRALAPLIDPNVHSCGTVYPHGPASWPTPRAASTWSG